MNFAPEDDRGCVPGVGDCLLLPDLPESSFRSQQKWHSSKSGNCCGSFSTQWEVFLVLIKGIVLSGLLSLAMRFWSYSEKLAKSLFL